MSENKALMLSPAFKIRITNPEILKTIFLIFVVTEFTHFTVNPQEQISGGPCTYKSTLHPATIIKIESRDSILADIELAVAFNNPGNSFVDTISYFMEEKKWVTFAQLRAADISLGSVLKYQEDQILTGSCSPIIRRVILEKQEKE